MDRRNTGLDNSNYRTALADAQAVPTFALYGEDDGAVLGHWLHCESIPARSSRNAWEIRPHRHRSYFQILYQSGGSGECLAEGASWRLEPPVAVTIPPGAVHGFRFSDDVDGWVLTIVGERVLSIIETLPELKSLLERPQLIELRGREAAPAIDAAFGLINSEFTGQGPARGALMDAQLRSIVILLARIAAPQDEVFATAAHRHAALFREHLDNNYRDQRSAGFYAGKLGVSQTHLNRICRTAFGKTALAVIHERIVLEASRDLAFTVMTVRDISQSLGFDDPAYFSRMFRKEIGASPMSFRRQLAVRRPPWRTSDDPDGAFSNVVETALAGSEAPARPRRRSKPVGPQGPNAPGPA